MAAEPPPTNCRAKGTRAKEISIGVVAVLFTGAAAEGILHIFPKLQPLPRTYIGEHSNRTGRSNLIADPVIGWRLKPSQSLGSAVHYRSNSAGFRSDREFAPPSRDRHRVTALIGDSFTFGYGVEYRDTFGARVEAALPATDVYNYGMTGFAMDQMWLTMHTRALSAAPSLVVVAFISGDFSRTLEAFGLGRGSPSRFIVCKWPVASPIHR